MTINVAMARHRPSDEQMQGFFHGMEHALSLAEDRKRGKMSAQAHAIRTELIRLRMLYEVGKERLTTTEPRKAWAPQIPLTATPNPLKIAGTVALMLCLFLVVTPLIARAVVIESDMRYEQICAVNAAQVNAYARSIGEPVPCP